MLRAAARWPTSRPIAAFFASRRGRPARTARCRARTPGRSSRPPPAPGCCAASARSRSTDRATGACARRGRALPAATHLSGARDRLDPRAPRPRAAASPTRPPAPLRACAYAHARLDHRSSATSTRDNRRSIATRPNASAAVRGPRGPEPRLPAPSSAATRPRRRCNELRRHPPRRRPAARPPRVDRPARRDPGLHARRAVQAHPGRRRPEGAARPAPLRPGARVGADRAARAPGRGGRPRSRPSRASS